ncbi:hypothetical protein Tco_1430722 [Tanacetum coccineum]
MLLLLATGSGTGEGLDWYEDYWSALIISVSLVGLAANQELNMRKCWKLQPRWCLLRQLSDKLRMKIIKKVCKPYIDDISTATKPHLDKARDTMSPYTKDAVIAYGKFLESTSNNHDLVDVQERLKLSWDACSAKFNIPNLLNKDPALLIKGCLKWHVLARLRISFGLVNYWKIKSYRGWSHGIFVKFYDVNRYPKDSLEQRTIGEPTNNGFDVGPYANCGLST